MIFFETVYVTVPLGNVAVELDIAVLAYVGASIVTVLIDVCVEELSYVVITF